MRVLRNALEDATERRVTLEEQLNDLSELHRNEIINIKHVRASDVTTQHHTPAKSKLLMCFMYLFVGTAKYGGENAVPVGREDKRLTRTDRKL